MNDKGAAHARTKAENTNNLISSCSEAKKVIRNICDLQSALFIFIRVIKFAKILLTSNVSSDICGT